MTLNSVTEEVIQERTKQVKLGFTAEHDDEHTGAELRDAAAHMIYPAIVPWPFVDGHPDVSKYRRNLIVAAAFCIAEVERFDRQNTKAAIEQASANYDSAATAIQNLSGDRIMLENIDRLVKARLKELKKEEKKAAKKKGKK